MNKTCQEEKSVRKSITRNKMFVIPTHSIQETMENYFVVLNLLHYKKDELQVKVHEKKHEVIVVARKNGNLQEPAHFWTFTVPSDAILSEIFVKRSESTLEIKIPRRMALAS